MQSNTAAIEQNNTTCSSPEGGFNSFWIDGNQRSVETHLVDDLILGPNSILFNDTFNQLDDDVKPFQLEGLDSSTSTSSSSSVSNNLSTKGKNVDGKLNNRDVHLKLESSSSKSDCDTTLTTTTNNNNRKGIGSLNSETPDSPCSDLGKRKDFSADDDLLENDSDDGENSTSKRPRRKLTAEERLKLARDRNREHARKTRLKKKMYLQELKQKVEELNNARVFAEMQLKHHEQERLRREALRRQTVRVLLALRGSKECNRGQWASVVDENFVYHLPIAASNCNPEERSTSAQRRHVIGIDNLIADTQVLQVTVAKISSSLGIPVYLEYLTSDKGFTVNDTIAMVQWTLALKSQSVSSINVPIVTGMSKCVFTPEGKIRSMEAFYDPAVFANQLQDMITIPSDLNPLESPADIYATRRLNRNGNNQVELVF